MRRGRKFPGEIPASRWSEREKPAGGKPDSASGGRDGAAIARDDGKIGGGEVEAGETGGRHPAKGDMLVRVGRGAAGRKAADEGKHLDDNVAVIVGEARQRADDGDIAAEFLTEFAGECGLGGFARLDLAAGKFPLEREVLVGGTLGEENPAGGVLQDGADDRKGSLVHHKHTRRVDGRGQDQAGLFPGGEVWRHRQ